jgi:asparagine synthetase B (glutamine-hydrolysing)
MIIECGPAHDIRTLYLELPTTKRIGVMVSGGIDSTLLYYLLQYLKKTHQTDHFIRPLMVPRHEGSTLYAKPMVNHVHRLLDLPESYPTSVGTSEVPDPKQVESGVVDALKYLKIDTVYIGAISLRPEHLINIEKPEVIETETIKFPLLNLEKSHIVDLYHKLGIESILQYTHSCNTSETTHCGTCNGCTERIWGFNELNTLSTK